jgi:predicted SnoaL-like aldol condensation-catalyzing enzyme
MRRSGKGAAVKVKSRSTSPASTGHRKIHFETVDVMRVQNGKITDHWGVGNLLSLMQQIGGWVPLAGTKR